MKSFRFKAILEDSGWLENAVVSIDDAGRIASVSQTDVVGAEFINGYALPAFQNAHSHAFQYAMAGLGENHAGDDDFWSWREMMYQLALELDPESLETIAQMFYTELVRNGYSNVAEFHYIHHDKDGVPYTNLAEMGEALVKAARNAGIKITLIPIFYQKGSFGVEPNERQKRFISKSFDDYKRLFEASAEVCQRYKHANVAVGVHSMRGVETTDIIRAATELPDDVPFHIHISEQLKEVEDSQAFLGKRPVEWMLENINLNERFHLVHATHLTQTETRNLAKSHANVVLCPSTEGNLGDGLFPLRDYQDFGGNWSIGTDSNIGLNPLEELRLLDYGQRLISHKRNTFGNDAGLFALTKAIISGRRGMNNFETGFFTVGADFDACVLDANAPLLANVKMENLASSILYSADASHFCGTFIAGKLIQKDHSYDLIKQKFVECVNKFR
ncbi:n-ethylammeline chlorohydrolase [Penicillium lagena]|uniref:n-ethylammeline chlorohydrolase n=1 Tax=Penicillium lagena TaxID=94218 RepID=UPI002541C880|nr:n-ethylammeline chlorohydrolase [Penicillium lagena]KAJ5605667.1 n-ethylammeline chlorohydrolase [Penicillium lagena]